VDESAQAHGYDAVSPDFSHHGSAPHGRPAVPHNERPTAPLIHPAPPNRSAFTRSAPPAAAHGAGTGPV